MPIPYAVAPGTMASGAANSLGFVAAAVPLDANGVSLIPELLNRAPTHNESELILGETIHLGSTNVSSLRWDWKEPAMYVEFLDGSLYVYHDVPLSVAVQMIVTASPGRFVWSVLRVGWPTPVKAQRIKQGTKGRRKPQVVRIVR